ncbi:hypothetical protein VTH06DRAFT_3196 [Thermothelomyces fergusii]
METRKSENPAQPRSWWTKARSLKLDPRSLNITTYQAHSASKFDEVDFIHLKAVWKTESIAKFHVRKYVRQGLSQKSAEKRREGILHTNDGKNRRILISQDYRFL